MCNLLEVKDLKENTRYFDESICPNCFKKLESSPLKKAKCPICKEYIYSRKHAISKRKMLLSESEIKEAEKYGIINEYVGITEGHPINKWFLKGLLCDLEISNEQYNEMKLQRNELSDIELLILLNKTALDNHLESFNLGLYRNCLSNISKLYSHDLNFKEALNYMNQIIYLDINGIRNNMRSLNLKLSKARSQCLPTLIFTTVSLNLLIYKKINLDTIETNFKNQSLNKKITYALSLNKAWDMLTEEFAARISTFLR